MNEFTDVKIEIFVPQDFALTVRDELAKAGIGRLGDYDHCVALVTIRGFFRPLPGSQPFEGEEGKISEVAEYKVEVNCPRDLVNQALQIIRRVHPYEEPLVNIIPLANHLFDMKSMSGQ